MQRLFFLILLTLGFQAMGQQSVLTISKKTGGIEKRLMAGDYVKVKTLQDSIIRGELVVFDDRTIIIDSISVEIGEIRWIKTSSMGWKAAGIKVMSGGVLYLAVAGITGAIQGYEPIYNEADFIVAGSFLAAGGIIIALSQRKFRMSKYEIDFISFQNLNTK